MLPARQHQSSVPFDRQSPAQGSVNSLYFSEEEHAGGLVFAYAKSEVREFRSHSALLVLPTNGILVFARWH